MNSQKIDAPPQRRNKMRDRPPLIDSLTLQRHYNDITRTHDMVSVGTCERRSLDGTVALVVGFLAGFLASSQDRTSKSGRRTPRETKSTPLCAAFIYGRRKSRKNRVKTAQSATARGYCRGCTPSKKINLVLRWFYPGSTLVRNTTSKILFFRE